MKKNLLLSFILIFNISSNAQVNFTNSNLPIVIINTNGKAILDDPKIMADMKIIFNGEGKNNLVTDSVNVYDGKIGIEIRGHSSQQFDKKQYGIELWDDEGESIDLPLLGMPEESDWVLNASYTDKSLLRNVIAYKLGNAMGRYASRTRFVEVVLNGEYWGIYILQEKIKRDKNRVNIKKLESGDIEGDALTGGYLFQIDRIDYGDAYFTSIFSSTYPQSPSIPSRINYIMIYPKADDILPVQLNYIKNYVTQFESALSKSTFVDPWLGYADLIDMDSFVDYFLVTEFTKATDAYRLSTYFHKNKDSEGGKLIMGPMWDYDLAFGMANYYNSWLPDGWQANNNPYQGDYSPPFWIKKIFNDPVFQNKIAKRWHQTKNTVFNPDSLVNFINSTVEFLDEAQKRNFSKWPELFDPSADNIWPNKYKFTSYQQEINYLLEWMAQRYEWIDNNLTPTYSDVEWLDADLSRIIFKVGRNVKLPLSAFVKSQTNISGFEFSASDASMDFTVENDSVEIKLFYAGEHKFKCVAKKSGEIVAVSPAYEITVITSVDSDYNLPNGFILHQNYPNPFNPLTTFSYELGEAGFVSLKIFDAMGREVARLINEFKTAGSYKFDFNSGVLNLSSGIYYYKIDFNGKSQTRKMILLK